MRELKFRGKRVDNGEWTCGDLIQLLGDQGKGRMFIVDNRFGACIDGHGNFVNTEAPFVNEVDPETVGEYTGLKDKNGKEIYEGDILQDESSIGEVEWVQEHCGFLVFSRTSEGNKYFRLENDGVLKSTEVIGNIYENADLIKEGEPA